MVAQSKSWLVRARNAADEEAGIRYDSAKRSIKKIIEA